MQRAIFEVQVINRQNGIERWVQVEAQSSDHARDLVTNLGEIVGEARLKNVVQSLPTPPIQPLQEQRIEWPPNGIRVPLLISAIFNIIVGLIWFVTIFGIVIAVPLWILTAFQFSAYSRIGRIPPKHNALKSMQAYGIIMIVAGLFNTATLICGILVLVNLGEANRRLRASMTNRFS